MKRVNEMAKNIQSKGSAARSKSATKPLARARAAETKRPAEQKKVRRAAIFKTDQWYENAAMSIGIVSRSKGGRPGAAVVAARPKDRGD